MTARLPTVTAERLVLRQLEPRDLEALYAVFSNPEVVRWFGTPRMTHPDDARRLLGEIDALRERGDLFQWGIALRDGDGVIGTATLAHILPGHHRAELGFALGRPSWGRGYAREAVRALVAHAFGPMDVHRLEADVDPRNTRSIALLEELGFVREGYARERWRVAGEWQDGVLYGLLAPEWEAAP